MTHDCWNGQDTNGTFYLECAPHEAGWSLTEPQAFFIIGLGVALLFGALILWRNLSPSESEAGGDAK